MRKVKPHKWVIEELDSGCLGVNDFWLCSDCGASGGPIIPKFDSVDKDGELIIEKDDDWIFYADGSGLQLPTDCNRAKLMIEEHLRIKTIGVTVK